MFSNVSSAIAALPTHSSPAIQTRPRLSVVLLSRGGAERLDSAIEFVLGSPFFLETELIVVRACRVDEDKVRLQRISRQLGFRLELAATDTPREILAGIGARVAAGDIVAVREDVRAGDALWLSAYVIADEATVWDASRIAYGEIGEFSPSAPRTQTRAPQADRVAPRPYGVPKWPLEPTIEPAT